MADASLFRSVFDNTLEASVVTDARGRELEANAEAPYLFRLSTATRRSSGRSS
jgi:hypothetical protein